MNEDFNFRPRQNSAPSNQQSQQSNSQPVDAPMEPAETAAPSAPPVVTTSRNSSGAGKKFLKFVGLLLVLALVAGGVYYWQMQEVKRLSASNTSLQGQVNDLKEESTKNSIDNEKTATPTQPAATTYTIITGSASRITETGADLAVYYQGTNLGDVWIEYGLEADSLETSTQKVKATGAGTAGSYVEQTFAVTGLQSGSQYFYRSAATQNGKTIYGGVVSLKTTK